MHTQSSLFAHWLPFFSAVLANPSAACVLCMHVQSRACMNNADSFSALRLCTQVWIISRHYSDDQRMGSLFQRIAQEIGDRVECAIDLSQIFKVPPEEALKLIKACKSVLEDWYKRYMEVRG